MISVVKPEIVQEEVAVQCINKFRREVFEA
jgi:hypothetical protein